MVVWNFELYMLPLALLLILAWNYCFTTSGGTEDMVRPGRAVLSGGGGGMEG